MVELPLETCQEWNVDSANEPPVRPTRPARPAVGQRLRPDGDLPQLVGARLAGDPEPGLRRTDPAHQRGPAHRRRAGSARTPGVRHPRARPRRARGLVDRRDTRTPTPQYPAPQGLLLRAHL